MINLLIKKLDSSAKIPEYGSNYAAGMDIFSNMETSIPSGSRKLISTGISLSWNGLEAENYYIRIAPRSGLSYKNSLDIGAGVIDYDYRGEIKVLLINNGSESFNVSKGMKIAQMILEKNYRPNIIETEELDSTERGENGFGSTGV